MTSAATKDEERFSADHLTPPVSITVRTHDLSEMSSHVLCLSSEILLHQSSSNCGIDTFIDSLT